MKWNHHFVGAALFVLLASSTDAASLFSKRRTVKVVSTQQQQQQQQQQQLWRRIPRGGDASAAVDVDTTTASSMDTTTTTEASATASTTTTATTTTADDSSSSPTPPVVVKETTPIESSSNNHQLSLLPMISEALSGLSNYMKGPKADTMILLLTTALNAPLCEKIGLSPILGFLSLGLLFGPNGRGFIQDIHTTELLADLGIVLFLFEMGLHVDLKTLLGGPLKRDVFGIGLTQFTATALLIGMLSKLRFGLSTAASIIVGWSLALSSSAFVLQLLKDKNEMESSYGKSSFGTLLLQDLMVVPLLVVTPILAGSGTSVSTAIAKAVLQITMAVSTIVLFGKFAMNPLLQMASNSCQEALVGTILAIVFGFSFLTEGLGLSNTLGPFLAGMLLADLPWHKHAVEKEASPFRGILVGLFFFTVGFEIDVSLVRTRLGLVSSLVAGLMTLKTAVATLACQAWKKKNENNNTSSSSWAQSQRVGLVLSQGGEFAFVAFRTARANGILTEEQTKLLLTSVSLTMALTPLAEDVGARIAARAEAAAEEEESSNNNNNNKKKNQ